MVLLLTVKCIKLQSPVTDIKLQKFKILVRLTKNILIFVFQFPFDDANSLVI